MSQEPVLNVLFQGSREKHHILLFEDVDTLWVLNRPALCLRLGSELSESLCKLVGVFLWGPIAERVVIALKN